MPQIQGITDQPDPYQGLEGQKTVGKRTRTRSDEHHRPRERP